MYNYYLNLEKRVLQEYHRSCTKSEDRRLISSTVLPLAILHAKIVTNVTNSQLGITKPPWDIFYLLNNKVVKAKNISKIK